MLAGGLPRLGLDEVTAGSGRSVRKLGMDGNLLPNALATLGGPDSMGLDSMLRLQEMLVRAGGRRAYRQHSRAATEEWSDANGCGYSKG